MLDACGFKTTTWSGYEHGKSVPSLSDLMKISKYFEVTETDLLHFPLSDANLNFAKQRFENYKNANLIANLNANLNDNLGPISTPAPAQPAPADQQARLQLYERLLASKEDTIKALQTALEAVSAHKNK